jgi:hypothetical protein
MTGIFLLEVTGQGQLRPIGGGLRFSNFRRLMQANLDRVLPAMSRHWQAAGIGAGNVSITSAS